MTKAEANVNYGIPIELLNIYERWGLQKTDSYDDADLTSLGLIMTLQEAGFAMEEIYEYLQLLQQGDSTKKERLSMVRKLRDKILQEVHAGEKSLDRLDYLKYTLQNES